jgi:hypothetical protein
MKMERDLVVQEQIFWQFFQLQQTQNKICHKKKKIHTKWFFEIKNKISKFFTIMNWIIVWHKSMIFMNDSIGKENHGLD